MQQRAPAISPDIVRFIEARYREAMAEFGLRSVKVSAQDDHAGDPSIFIDVEFDLSERPIDLKRLWDVHERIRDYLWDIGEPRFAYVRHHFHEDQASAEPR
jgi:hypothetical protein